MHPTLLRALQVVLEVMGFRCCSNGSPGLFREEGAPLVGWSILPSLSDMPEDARGVGYIGNAQSPWLQCRRLRWVDPKFYGQIKSKDMVPPGIEIIDHQLQHAVLCITLMIIIR
jgi:hypothetical protein